MIDISITFYIDMKEKILNSIKEHNLIEYGDSILVGFSGGKDSTCLLYFLMEIKDSLNLNIYTAHFNHGVRGDEADRDEKFCMEVSKKLGVKFFSDYYNMDKYASEEKISKEAAGRKLRKSFFNRITKENNIKKIALAHNYNDQVETLLMRIIRGTGLDGLVGIEYKSGNIIRPLLGIKRTEIEKYIYENNILYVEDSTNEQNDYNRNKFRNQIIPILKSEFNPNVEEAIFNLSKLARDDVNYLNKMTDFGYNRCVKKEQDIIILDIDNFKKEDTSIQKRIIRKIFREKAGFLEDLSLTNVEDIINLTTLSSGKYIDNINNLKIRNSYGKLIFENVENIYKKEDNFKYINLKKGINIFCKREILVEEVNYKSTNPNEITIPKEFIKDKLVLRNRIDGDRIRPIGLEGTKKLKNIFIDKKIDRNKRDSYLIISDDEKIYWVVDLVKSEFTKMDSITNSYIKIKIKNLEDNHARSH